MIKKMNPNLVCKNCNGIFEEHNPNKYGAGVAETNRCVFVPSTNSEKQILYRCPVCKNDVWVSVCSLSSIERCRECSYKLSLKRNKADSIFSRDEIVFMENMVKRMTNKCCDCHNQELLSAANEIKAIVFKYVDGRSK